ncbi:hypothetical protein QJQ45_001551 [Haematococcus lacustris]|nr:hypothetical protein QJQ45_001551 [Haematococcus lacustris]
MAVEAADIELEDSDDGVYFKYLGGVQFQGSHQVEAPGSTRCLQVSNRFGLVLYPALEPHGCCVFYHPAMDGITQLALSSDELVLAAVTQNTVVFFNLPQLVRHAAGAAASMPPQPQYTLSFAGGVRQLSWCKDPQHASQLLVLTADLQLLIATCGSPAVQVANNVEAVDWAPHSPLAAFTEGHTLCWLDLTQPEAQVMTSLELQHLAALAPMLVLAAAPGASLLLESVVWVRPSELVLGAVVVEDEAEGPDAHVLHLRLQGQLQRGAPPPATLLSLLPQAIEETSTPHFDGPYLHCCAVPAWSLLVMAHRKAMDDHIMLLQTAPEPSQLQVTHNNLRIALPNGPGGADNFVLGLAFSTTVDLGPLPHPLSPERPDLAAPPLLLIATSDAVLRFYALGHQQHQASLLHTPQPLPASGPDWLTDKDSQAAGQQGAGERVGEGDGGVGAAAAGALDQQAEKALQAELPESDEEFEDDDEEEQEEEEEGDEDEEQDEDEAAAEDEVKCEEEDASKEGRGGDAEVALAAATSGCNDFPGQAEPPLPARPSLASLPPGLGTSRGEAAARAARSAMARQSGGASALPQEATQRALASALPDSGSGDLSDDDCNGGSSKASAWGQATAAPAATLTPSPSFFSAFTPQASAAGFAGGTAPPSQPTAPSFSFPTAAPAASVQLAPPAASPPRVQAPPIPSPPPPAPPPPPPLSPAERAAALQRQVEHVLAAPLPGAQAPVPRLSKAGPELSSLEADFLASLHEARRMAVDLDTLLSPLQSTGHAPSASSPAAAAAAVGGPAADLLGPAAPEVYWPVCDKVAHLQQESSRLRKALSAAQEDVVDLGTEAVALERRLAALQLFRPGGSAGADLARLHHSLPLEPALAELRSRVQAQLAGSSRCMDDLAGLLDAWEAEARPGSRGPLAVWWSAASGFESQLPQFYAGLAAPTPARLFRAPPSTPPPSGPPPPAPGTTPLGTPARPGLFGGAGGGAGQAGSPSPSPSPSGPYSPGSASASRARAITQLVQKMAANFAASKAGTSSAPASTSAPAASSSTSTSSGAVATTSTGKATANTPSAVGNAGAGGVGVRDAAAPVTKAAAAGPPPAGAAAKPRAASSQPPVPDMAAVMAAQKLRANVLGGAAQGKTSSAPAQSSGSSTAARAGQGQGPGAGAGTAGLPPAQPASASSGASLGFAWAAAVPASNSSATAFGSASTTGQQQQQQQGAAPVSGLSLSGLGFGSGADPSASPLGSLPLFSTSAGINTTASITSAAASSAGQQTATPTSTSTSSSSSTTAAATSIFGSSFSLSPSPPPSATKPSTTMGGGPAGPFNFSLPAFAAAPAPATPTTSTPAPTTPLFPGLAAPAASAPAAAAPPAQSTAATNVFGSTSSTGFFTQSAAAVPPTTPSSFSTAAGAAQQQQPQQQQGGVFAGLGSAGAAGAGAPGTGNWFGAGSSSAGGTGLYNAFGQPATPGGFGQPPSGVASTTPAFGQPSSLGGGGGFGQPSGFGSSAPVAPAFGQASAFGQAAPVTPGFGQSSGIGGGAAAPSFGASGLVPPATSGNTGFAMFAAQSAGQQGFGALAQQAQQNPGAAFGGTTGFGAPAPSGGFGVPAGTGFGGGSTGFGAGGGTAFNSQPTGFGGGMGAGGGFGAFGGGGVSPAAKPFGSAAGKSPSSTSPNLWAPRNMMRTGIIPAAWKVARISPLFKDTDPTDPNKYRMLAVSSVLYRLYANVLRHVLTAWCMTHKVLPAEQFGFIPGRSTMQPMFILRHLVHAQKASADAKHRKLFTAFIDFKQAYDHIPRQQLWEHLRVGVKLPQPLLACLEGLYRDDSYVLIDGPHRTPPVTPDQGVKQGCPISPLLFALYVHDISKEFLGPVDAVRVQGTPVTHFMYADDLTLVSTSSHGLQRLVCQLQGFADRKHLTVNVGKSKVMVFNGNSQTAAPSIGYKHEILPVVREFKYLGMHFNPSATPAFAATHMRAGMFLAMRQACKRAREYGVLHDPYALCHLIRAFVLPLGLYGSQVWGTAFLGHGVQLSNPVQTRMLSFLRFAARVRSSVSGLMVLHELGQLPLQLYWLRAACKFWNTAKLSHSDLLMRVIKADVELGRSCQASWSAQFQLAARELMGGEFTLSPDMVLGTKAMEVKWLESMAERPSPSAPQDRQMSAGRPCQSFCTVRHVVGLGCFSHDHVDDLMRRAD